MKHLFLFENFNNIENVISFDYITRFKSEKELDEFLMDLNDVDNQEDISWDNAGIDVIKELGLYEKFPNINKEELYNIVVDILININLDSEELNQYRDNYDAWLMKNNVDKYNL